MPVFQTGLFQPGSYFRTIANPGRLESSNGPGVYCRRGSYAPGVRCVFHRDSGAHAIDLPPSSEARWRAVARVLRSTGDSVACALLPAECALCGSHLPRLSSVPICDSCWAEFPALSPESTGPSCSRCGDSIETPAPALCRACRLVPPPFVRAVAYGLSEGRMRQAIHALKYDRLHPAARNLGRMLATAITQLAAEAPAEMLVVPIPLHRSKNTQRGFNQARALAREALISLHRIHPEWRLTLAPSTLMRLRATESQAGLTRRQRRINVRGAFFVSNATFVAGKHILLVDDILTTGATARAAASSLTRAGAASVWVATLARARRSGPPPAFAVQSKEDELTETAAAHNAATSPTASFARLEGQQPF
jgi:ComF family protein